MAQTFLLAWNPKYWDWTSFSEDREKLEKGIPVIDRWGMFAHTQVNIGDRFYLMRLGVEPRGIMASGTIASLPFEGLHWSRNGYKTSFVEIQFDTLLDPEQDILSLQELNEDIPSDSKFRWTIRRSGMSIPESIATALDKRWIKYQELEKHFQEKIHLEGKARETISKTYERNRHAREECLEAHGYNCFVCGFNFQDIYGELGKGYIEVHHRFPISLQKGIEYRIDPKKDLVPVCANCHRMLHRNENVTNDKNVAKVKSVEELKQALNRN